MVVSNECEVLRTLSDYLVDPVSFIYLYLTDFFPLKYLRVVTGWEKN